MALFDKVRPHELLRGGEVNTFTATGVSGEHYLLHWLPADGTPALARVLKMLDELPREARSLLLELGSRDGKAYLVTGHPASFTTLEEWLQAVHGLFAPAKPDLEKKGVWRVPGAVTPKPAASDRLDPGEAPTREMTAFGMPAVPSAAPPVPAAAAPIPVAPIPVAPIPVVPAPAAPAGFSISGGLKEAGEFTRMMRSPSAAPAANPVVPAAKPAVPEAGVQAPGEFTRLFASQGHQLVPAEKVTPAPVPEMSKPEQGPGEFTRLFIAPEPVQKVPELPATANQESVEGEFTRLFGAQAQQQPSPQQPVPQQVPQLATPVTPAMPATPVRPETGPGEFTRLMNAVSAAPPPMAKAPIMPPPMPSPMAPPAASEPGEFTRLMSVNPAPPVPGPQSPPANFAPSMPPASEPGEFTRLLQSPLAQSPAARPQDVSQEYERMFGSQAGRQPEPSMPQAVDPVYGATRLFNAPPGAPKVETPMGPSEYTRLMAAVPRADAPAAPAKPAAEGAKPVAKAPKKDQMILIAVLAVLAICAIALIAYFAFAK